MHVRAPLTRMCVQCLRVTCTSVLSPPNTSWHLPWDYCTSGGGGGISLLIPVQLGPGSYQIYRETRIRHLIPYPQNTLFLQNAYGPGENFGI